MNCDPLARWYRALEYLGLGRALERRRFEFLSDLTEGKTPRRALLLGDGDGRFLSAFLRRTTALADYVDSSAMMLSLARRRSSAAIGTEQVSQRAEFHHADALNWQPGSARTYDLVVTHFFLDCLVEQQIDALIVRLIPFLALDAVWIVSEFRQPARGFAAWRAKLWIGGLYRLFGWATGLQVRRLPDHRSVLIAHGFRLEKEVVANRGLLVSEEWRRQGRGFCVDAPTDEHLHSRTPKS